MHIDEYLRMQSRRRREKGEPESDWLDFCELALPSGELLMDDVGLIMNEGGTIVTPLPPGKYVLQVKIQPDNVMEGCISRLRVLQEGVSADLGEDFDAVLVDAGMVGFCDNAAFTRLWEADKDALAERLEAALTDNRDGYGTAELDATTGTVIAFVTAGLGDGAYPVYELLSNSELVGVEIVFLGPDGSYPP